jgi:hypothetical protein
MYMKAEIWERNTKGSVGCHRYSLHSNPKLQAMRRIWRILCAEIILGVEARTNIKGQEKIVKERRQADDN